ncbi:MAG TPA: hypothetical protein VJO16_02250 [Candidatus Acidoferrum sp.]|nr:hypothetical protein [Candidatus Acidoferrum sp.]
MPSSTSNSRHPAIFHAKLLFGFCAIVIVLIELMSHYMLKHHSETYARVSQQYAQALTVRPAGPSDPASVLMVGNSLLLYGVDVNRLSELTSGRVHVYPIFLEGTGYYDWFYALRRLFLRGARPQVVVVGVGLNEFFSNSVRLDYAPLLLFNQWDILGVASTLKLDRTDTADLALDHLSTFWDLRNVIRLQILSRAIPHYKDLVLMLKAQPTLPSPEKFDSLAQARLARLRTLCESHGARLVLLIPPAPSSENAIARLTLDANNAGVATLVPVNPRTLPLNFYLADRIHLNPQGAEVFTSALAADLPKTASQASLYDPN